MGEEIRFRARLSNDDWDRGAGAFRCTALSIPRAAVTAIHAAGAELAPSEFTVDYKAHEIRLHARQPPGELLVSIALESKLTSLRTAGASGSLLALTTALIAALAQYFTAVEPAKLSAQTAREQLVAQTEKHARCELALKEGTRPTSEPSAAPDAQESNTTHGDVSPIVHGSGTVSIHGR